MKISFGIIVHNGEPFIKYQIENLYPFAHEILIVEGAVEKFKHASTPEGHSKDDTLEVIKNFPDPSSKIKLITREGFWPEKTEMSNAYMDACSGDYIWQIDVDEFYRKEDIQKIISILSENPEIEQVSIKTLNFWRSFQAIMQGASYAYGADEFIRIFKFRRGLRYLTHRPPTLMDENGKELKIKKSLNAKELFTNHGIAMYHYSYVFPEGVKSKSSYYAQMGWGKGCEDGLKWAEDCWEKFQNPLRIHLIDFPPSWIVPFVGRHPEIIEEMLKEIDFREDSFILNFLKSDWKKYAEAGERATSIYLKAESREIGKLKAAVSILKLLMPPKDLMSIRANKSIFKTLKRSLAI
ncbi:MAG: glycosyltransferase [Deltaproteobacteria bacterium]|nr:glycosyltransferase [Deltaproteobacteria bacterium]